MPNKSLNLIKEDRSICAKQPGFVGNVDLNKIKMGSVSHFSMIILKLYCEIVAVFCNNFHVLWSN